MNRKNQPGLGELLRHVSELVELGAQEHDQQMGVNDRARCPPVLRVIGAGAQTITEITARTHLTQGAIRQTVGYMETDGVIPRQRAGDGRKSTLQLTAAGKKLVGRLALGHHLRGHRASGARGRLPAAPGPGQDGSSRGTAGILGTPAQDQARLRNGSRTA